MSDSLEFINEHGTVLFDSVNFDDQRESGLIDKETLINILKTGYQRPFPISDYLKDRLDLFLKILKDLSEDTVFVIMNPVEENRYTLIYIFNRNKIEINASKFFKPSSTLANTLDSDRNLTKAELLKILEDDVCSIYKKYTGDGITSQLDLVYKRLKYVNNNATFKIVKDIDEDEKVEIFIYE